MRRTPLVIASLFVFLLPGSFRATALGQNSLSVPTPDTAIGNSPLASYDVGAIDAVNPVNGNLFLQLPLLSFPQRGKSLRLNFKIYYNDKAWNIRYNPPNPNNPAGSQGVGQWQMPVVQGVTVARDQNLTFWNNTSNDGANPRQFRIFSISTETKGVLLQMNNAWSPGPSLLASIPDGTLFAVDRPPFLSCRYGPIR